MTLQCCNHKVAPGPAKQPFAAPLDLLPEQVDLLGEQLDLLREQLFFITFRDFAKTARSECPPPLMPKLKSTV